MTEYIGDLAAKAAEELHKTHATQNGEECVDESGPMHGDVRRSIFTKIEFSWRPGDAKVLDQIRTGADLAFAKMFTEAIRVIDDFYSRVKIPEVDANGELTRDSEGRVLFRKDAQGREIEDWGQLSAHDVENTLLDLLKLKLVLTPLVDELLLEAVFAKYIADDASAEGYLELLEGTVGDRTAHANRASRKDKYEAFFRYYLYRQADSFMKELANFTRVCERIRYWRSESGSQASRAY